MTDVDKNFIINFVVKPIVGALCDINSSINKLNETINNITSENYLPSSIDSRTKYIPSRTE